MKWSRAETLGLVVATALCAAVLPSHAAAQSELDVAEAQAFMGKWVISMQTDFGPFQMDLDLADQAGKVAASIGSPEMGGTQPVTDITRSGESLMLEFEADAQGQVFDVSVALVPNGENLIVLFEVGTGEFSASGVATRPAS
ncbi:MAG TPA: hypothetical protein VM198_12770 [Longimicrobiales bacterium]|nr:hypothetical protein [Longimicrobiales bacterium]